MCRKSNPYLQPFLMTWINCNTLIWAYFFFEVLLTLGLYCTVILTGIAAIYRTKTGYFCLHNINPKDAYGTVSYPCLYPPLIRFEPIDLFSWNLVWTSSISGAFAKWRKATVSFVMSVCLSVCPPVLPSVRPHGTTRLPLDAFSCNLISEYFFENLSRKFKFH
jgi:hypothetical protein